MSFWPFGHRLRPQGRVAGLAVVVVLLAATVIAVAALKFTRSDEAKEPATAPAHTVTVPTSFVQDASGRNYRPSTIAPGVRALLGLPSDAERAKRAGSVPSALKQLRTPKRLFACVRAVAATQRAKPVPLAVDLARWQGDPAAVIALPSAGHGGAADVLVVGPGCARHPSEAHILFRRQVSLAERPR
jgi:hypothetical protein